MKAFTKPLSGVLLLALALCAAAPARAQESPPQEEVFDPYRAEKNLEVGTFYLKKKNYDAAIDRLLESIRYKPNFARPHLLLGQAYEKKNQKALAAEYYEKYLQILPGAPDAKKVRRRIEKLKRDLERQAARKKRP
jgi:Tfp pilus assembly protein PilF